MVSRIKSFSTHLLLYSNTQGHCLMDEETGDGGNYTPTPKPSTLYCRVVDCHFQLVAGSKVAGGNLHGLQRYLRFNLKDKPTCSFSQGCPACFPGAATAAAASLRWFLLLLRVLKGADAAA